jgi:hypothetical protein
LHFVGDVLVKEPAFEFSIMNRYITLLVIVAYLSGCGDKQIELTTVTQYELEKFNLELEIDSINISVGSQQREFYGIFSTLQKENSFLYIGWNKSTYSLDIFDLNTNQFIESIPLEKEGPNGVGTPEGIIWNSYNQIFIITDYQIVELNLEGEVTKKWRINAKDDSFYASNYFDSYDGRCFFFDNETQDFIIGVYNVAISATTAPQQYYATRVFGRLNYNTAEAEVFNLTFPPAYQEAYLGFYENVNADYANGEIIASFPGTSDLLSYNRDSKISKRAVIEPLHTKSVVPPLGWHQTTAEDLKIRHYFENQNFSAVLFGSKGNLYRVYYESMPESRKNFTKPFSSKGLYLTIVDREKGVYNDYLIPSRKCNAQFSFLMNGSLVIPLFVQNEGELKFIKVNINYR